ncbi:MAG: 3'-5' exonuclease [Hydrogenophilaceae bacterium]|nr:3'-5' exonuclease [Hydrogenophilaceae bacterium]
MIWPFTRKPRVDLPEAESRRLNALKSIKPPSSRTPLNEMRWVVVDVETGGLNPRTDPLLSIGAVEILGGQINLGSGCEVRLRQETATSHDNILIHGLTDSQQLTGLPAREALLQFAEFAQVSPRVAFHAAFDRDALDTAFKKELGWHPAHHWLDAAVIAPLLFAQHAAKCRHLDDWLETLCIANFSRHSAVADAAATAQLWLILLDAARHQKLATLKDLESLARSRHWLGT